MDDNIKLLEERVEKAAVRLRELTAERERLESELRMLRDRVKQAQPKGAVESDSEREDWRSQKAMALDAIREVIADLRG